jgi:acyl carrier protein
MTPHSKSLSRIAEQIYDALGKYLRRDPTTFHPEDSLCDDLGLDSLMTIEMLYEIESVFDIQIPDEDFVGLVTIGNVVAYIEKRKQSPSSRKSAKSSPSTPKPKAASGPSKSTPPARKGR